MSTHVSAAFSHSAALVRSGMCDVTNGMPPYNAMRSSNSNWNTSKFHKRYGSPDTVSDRTNESVCSGRPKRCRELEKLTSRDTDSGPRGRESELIRYIPFC